jgi:hypothetical protein
VTAPEALLGLWGTNNSAALGAAIDKHLAATLIQKPPTDPKSEHFCSIREGGVDLGIVGASSSGVHRV